MQSLGGITLSASRPQRPIPKPTALMHQSCTQLTLVPIGELSDDADRLLRGLEAVEAFRNDFHCVSGLEVGRRFAGRPSTSWGSVVCHSVVSFEDSLQRGHQLGRRVGSRHCRGSAAAACRRGRRGTDLHTGVKLAFGATACRLRDWFDRRWRGRSPSALRRCARRGGRSGG